MSPTDSPAQGQKYIPLPTPLPTKEEEERARKAKKALKEKPKVSIKSHKHHQSYDTGYGSASPYSYEERSPEQYIPSPKSAKPKPDTTPYETIDGKSGTTRYITKTKDGKVVRYVSRKSISPIDAGYGAAKPAEPYKTKYKAAKETTKALQDALYDSTETAQHNYVAAKEQEAKRLSASAQIDALEEQLRSLRLKAQIYEDLAETAERQRLVAERKLREQEIKQKIADQKKERTLLEEDFARRQWDEIEAMPASPSPITRRPARTPLIEQASKPRRNNTATPSPYTSQAMTTASQVPGILAPTGNPFLDPILEAQKDEEDRRRATGIQYSSSRRERRRGDDRYK